MVPTRRAVRAVAQDRVGSRTYSTAAIATIDIASFAFFIIVSLAYLVASARHSGGFVDALQDVAGT
jgi:hypothetical protein